MAARTPKIATMGNLIAAGLTFIVGITFSFLGGYMRQGYGPDSQFASFTVDTCSKFLDLSACAAWEPDPDAFFKLATKEVCLCLHLRSDMICCCLLSLLLLLHFLKVHQSSPKQEIYLHLYQCPFPPPLR